MDTSKQSQVASIFRQFHEVDITETCLEFTYEGKDLGDRVVECFKKLAMVVGTADGELRCKIDDDDETDSSFLFYTIKDSCVYKQQGRLVRSIFFEKLPEPEPS